MSGQETANGEWTTWRDAWVAEAGTSPPAPATLAAPEAPVADLLRRLHRQRLRLLAVALGEVLALILLVAATVAILHGGAAAWQVVWLITLWVFACVAAGFAWWNRRSTWRAAGTAVEDAVRLARLRAERQLRTSDFVLLLYGAETLAVVAQLAWFGRLVPIALWALAAGAAIVGAWYVLTRRRLRRELERIDAFERERDAA